jgi:hypothetical protein
MPATPTSRPPRIQVSVQVARGGGAGRAEPAGEAASARGRHRTPDTGRLPDPERVGGVGTPRAAVIPAQPGARRPLTRAATGHDEAVTDLVAGPTRRADDDAPDAPATGPVPGLLGLALGVLALLGAVAAAAAPGLVLPVVGPLATSPLALAALLATGLLATVCACLGAGRHRTGRAVAVTGLVVALAAVTATIVPLLALSV